MDVIEQETIDPFHIVDMILFGLIGGLAWTGASLWEQPWLILFGLPWMVLFLVSVWRVVR
jgi:hypothetical protein